MCEAHRRLIRRLFIEIINEGHLAAIDEVYAVNFIDRNSLRGQPLGPAGVRQTLAELRATLPDLHVTVEELKVEAGTVITREIWKGTHTVTSRQAEGVVTHIFLINDNQIVEEWSGGWEWLDRFSTSAVSST